MQKQKIGCLLRIIRVSYLNRSKSKKWTQTAVCRGICSLTTMVHLEQGKECRDDEVYQSICAKYGFQLRTYQGINFLMQQFNQQLIQSMEQNNRERVLQILISYELFLKKARKFIYYAQCYEMVCILKEYYASYQLILPKQDEYYIGLLSIFDHEFSSILRPFLYMYFHYTKTDVNFLKLVKELELEKDDFLCSQIAYSHFLLVNGDNRFHQVFLHTYHRMNYSNKEWLNSFTSLLKHYKHLFQRNLPLLLQEIYKEGKNHSCSWMKKLNDANIDHPKKREVQEILNAPFLPIRFYLEWRHHGLISEEMKYQGELLGDFCEKTFYEYTKLNLSKKARQLYLMKTILPLLKHMDSFYWYWFVKELHMLCEQTRKYKDVYLFMKYEMKYGPYYYEKV